MTSFNDDNEPRSSSSHLNTSEYPLSISSAISSFDSFFLRDGAIYIITLIIIKDRNNLEIEWILVNNQCAKEREMEKPGKYFILFQVMISARKNQEME